ncbi:S9 family peptidase [Paenibacillus macerans]|uniref:S9 family peptidase n=1 Tax=Paenibacillus macerans TaxID=44252 RepID=UPI002DB80556|nr:S9 family peptidase [Paenibacillus macerans]MEC0331305.1 S9 family peptidase [Paenibacillus macerans]
MNKRPIMPDDLYGYQWVSQPSVNPRGLVAYVNQTVDREKNDYITHIRAVSLDGSGDRRLTGGDKDSAPSWSPDGSRLAFLRPAEGGKQLYTVPAEGEAAEPDQVQSRLAVKHTALTRGVNAFVWSPDGRYIALMSRAGADVEPQLQDKPQVQDKLQVQLQVQDKPQVQDKLQVQDKPQIQDKPQLQERHQSQSAHPEQPALRGRVFERTTPKTEGSGWWDGLYSQLFVLELETGRITQLTSGPWDVSAPVWSPDGEALSFVSKRVEDELLDADLLHFADVYTVKLSGGQPIGKPVKITASDLLISQFAYAPDGRRLTLIASDRVYGSGSHNRLYTVPAAGGTPELLAPGLDMQLGNAALGDMKSAGASPSPLYDPHHPQLGVYVLGTDHGNVNVYRIDGTGACEAVTGGGEKDVYQYTLSPDGRYMVTAALTAERPGELYRVDVRTGEELRLTRRNDEFLAELEVRIPERIAFKASDGPGIHGWLLKPAGLPQGAKVPLILQIHGGPHAMYTGVFSHEMQTLAALGYAVLWVNPRGSMGYGQDFAKACRGDFGGGDCRDLLEAVDYALAAFDFIDETRLGIGGGSYGGVMTNWIVAHTNRFRAAVTHRSISNWLSMYGTSDIGISYVEGVIGGNPQEHAELLWSKSPLAHAHRIETPLLILHGENDYRTPISQAEELYTALKRYGKTTKLIRYPSSNHTLLKSGKPSLRVDSFEQVNAWFGQYL